MTEQQYEILERGIQIESFKAGDFVYMDGSPKSAGVVTDTAKVRTIVNNASGAVILNACFVKWVKNGPSADPEIALEWWLRSLPKLIEDHKKKLAVHEKMLERLQKLA